MHGRDRAPAGIARPSVPSNGPSAAILGRGHGRFAIFAPREAIFRDPRDRARERLRKFRAHFHSLKIHLPPICSGALQTFFRWAAGREPPRRRRNPAGTDGAWRRGPAPPQPRRDGRRMETRAGDAATPQGRTAHGDAGPSIRRNPAGTDGAWRRGALDPPQPRRDGRRMETRPGAAAAPGPPLDARGRPPDGAWRRGPATAGIAPRPAAGPSIRRNRPPPGRRPGHAGRGRP